MARGRRGGRLWSQLSPAYRARLEREGIGREEWLRGADLRRARGHTRTLPTWAAPRPETVRLLAGEATEADIATLEAWNRENRPDWASGEMSMDTAAALTQIGVSPARWEDVDIVPRGGERNWVMMVTPTNGYPITIEIPGGSLAIEVLEFLTELGIDFVVHGTP